MAYLTGTASDFMTRVHSLSLTSLPTGADFIPSGLADIDTFVTEGRSYLTNISAESGKWEMEARLKCYQLSQSGSRLLTQMF